MENLIPSINTVIRERIFITLSFILLSMHLYGQKGPGGISHESGGDSECKVWFNAGSLNLADGALVDSIEDLSQSAVKDYAFQNSSTYQPKYRSDLSASVNGQPVLSFNEFPYLEIAESDDINETGSSSFNFRNYSIVLRTGNDVTSRQVVYEQGGSVKGFNIVIDNKRIYFTAYDDNGGGSGGDNDGTPAFNPVSVVDTILANHNYAFIYQYYGPTGSTDGYMLGFVNGAPMGPKVTGVGAVYQHTNPGGLGAVNGQTVFYDNSSSSTSGEYPFNGKIAEFIAYNDTLNAAERIILENYLGAKYGDDVLTNDYYAYEDNYGFDVIGLGKENGDLHDKSQGENVFSIQGVSGAANFDDGEFLLAGHNGAGLTITTSNVPDVATTKRVAREWRFSHTSNLGEIEFRGEASDLPSFGAGYDKYVLILDTTGGLTSNFTGSNVQVLELAVNPSGAYKVITRIPDGTYATIGAVKPQATFAFPNDYTFETDANSLDSVKVVLNYVPGTDDTIDYVFSNGSATLNADYEGIDSFLIFPQDINSRFIYFNIVGDLVAESSESFSIKLVEGANTSADLKTGAIDSLNFSIYDNDNIPEVSFGTPSGSFSEGAGVVNIDVIRSGSTGNAFTVDAHLRTSGSQGTATLNNDYTFSASTLSFAAGETVKQLQVILINDDKDENNETIYLELSNAQGFVDLIVPTEFAFTIQDDDAPPTVEFQDATFFSPETFGTPDVNVVLSAPSDLTVSVEWARTGGTATFNADYTCPASGVLTFSPGETLKRIPITPMQDANIGEPDETVEFDLLNNSNLVNASLGTQDEHIFTIKDYSAYEWTGPAGVGDISEIALWVDASRETFTDGSGIPDITNFANVPVTLTKNNSGARYQTTGPNLINDRPVFYFNGNDDSYKTNNSGIISGHSDNRDFFIAFRTGSNVNSLQFIYDGGGESHGIGIYIWKGDLYFYMWSPTNNVGTPWGINPRTFVSGSVSADTDYIVHGKFDQLQTYGGDKLELYINGTKVGGDSDASINRHNGHSEHQIGRRNNGARWTDGSNHGSSNGAGDYFQGAIAEIIVFQNAPVNNTRKRLIENYLSAKYDITIPNQIHSVTQPSDYTTDLAGIGKASTGDEQLDAQGHGLVRVNFPDDLDDGEYLLWYGNGVSVSNSVSTQLPAGVNSRIGTIWAVDETGDVGNVNLSIDLSEANTTGLSSSDFELLIHNNATDSDFSNAIRHTGGRSFSGDQLSFANVDLNDGDFFSVTMDATDSVSLTWVGSVDNDWFNDANWSPVQLPVSTDNVLIPEVTGGNSYPEIFVTAGLPAEVFEITIAANAELTVSGELELHGDIENNGLILGDGKLEFKGSSSTIVGNIEFDGIVAVTSGATLNANNALTIKSGGTLLHGTGTPGGGGTVNGVLTVQRTKTNSPSSFNYWSSPVLGANANILGSQLYYYDPADATDNSENGLRKGWNAANGMQMQTAQGVISTDGGTVSFNGPAHNAPTGSPLQISVRKNNGVSNDIGWNLVGNPFPGSMDADAFLAHNNSVITGAIYLWDDPGTGVNNYTTQDYFTHNYLGATPLFGPNSNTQWDGHVTSGQGFLVEKIDDTPSSETIEFTNSMRSTENDAFFRQAPKSRLWLSVNGSGYYGETLIGFMNDADDGYDTKYDAKKLKGNSDLALYSRMNGEAYAIQGLAPLSADKEVALGMDVHTAGTYTISLAQIEHIDKTVLVILEDRDLGIYQNLRLVPEYVFNSIAGTDIDRFYLHFNAPLQISTSDVSCYGNDGEIHLNQPGNTTWDFIMVNEDGDMVDYANNFNGFYTIQNLPAGDYSLALNSEGYEVTQLITLTGKSQVSAAFNVPASTFYVNDLIQFNNLSTGANYYQWDFGDGTVMNGVSDPIHQYASEGIYTVRLEASNTACSSILEQEINISSLTTTAIENDLVNIPTVFSVGKKIYIKFSTDHEKETRVIVYDLTGRKVLENLITKGSNIIDMARYANGHYIVTLKTANTQYEKKVPIIGW